MNADELNSTSKDTSTEKANDITPSKRKISTNDQQLVAKSVNENIGKKPTATLNSTKTTTTKTKTNTNAIDDKTSKRLNTKSHQEQLSAQPCQCSNNKIHKISAFPVALSSSSLRSTSPFLIENTTSKSVSSASTSTSSLPALSTFDSSILLSPNVIEHDTHSKAYTPYFTNTYVGNQFNLLTTNTIKMPTRTTTANTKELSSTMLSSTTSSTKFINSTFISKLPNYKPDETSSKPAARLHRSFSAPILKIGEAACSRINWNCVENVTSFNRISSNDANQIHQQKRLIDEKAVETSSKITTQANNSRSTSTPIMTTEVAHLRVKTMNTSNDNDNVTHNDRNYNEHHHIREDLRFGCAHYKRRAMFVTPCCNKFYKCRFCHDENESHHFDRKTLNELICSECNTRQKVQEACGNCGIRFGKYTCLICNLFDDEEKKQYHCDACGICRIGGAENFFHCEVCNMCLPIQLKIDGHKCVENISRSHCPVCLGDIHTSRIPCHIPDCGHLLHKMCFDQLLASGHYACPTCQTSLIDMTALWDFLDAQASHMPMPKKYDNQKIHIFCNDCQRTSKTNFHFIGLKCLKCGAYNTTQDVKRRVSLVPDETNTA